jgi:hypothetical protein
MWAGPHFQALVDITPVLVHPSSAGSFGGHKAVWRVKLTLADDDFDFLAAQVGFLVFSEVLPVNPPKRDLYTTNETRLKMDAARWRMA